MNRAHTRLTAGLVFSLAVVTAASAEEYPDPFAAYAKCAAIDADAERLACFDGLRPTMAVAAGDAESQAQLASKRADAFGAEKFAEEDEIEDIEKLSEIHSAVAKIELMEDRRLKVTLENGQVWRQKPDDRIVPAPKEGVARSAVIRRAMFGRYLMTLEPEGRTIRVARQE